MTYFKIIFLAACVLVLGLSCATTNLKEYEKKDRYSNSQSVLGLNSINADNSYYARSVLDYLFIKRIIESNSFIYFGTPKNVEIGSPADTIRVQKSSLFPQLHENYEVTTPEEEKIVADLKALGLKNYTYDVPTTLNDLQSGFQFNHYVFQSSNRAAMQAFGIVDSEVSTQSLYIITDYLQYLDVNCGEIPTIRYAVGMRAEFRIADVKSESDLKGIGSLAGLAAQVETGQRRVNITIKTIGITGIDSRISIPTNTTFDVRTYSDYESIVEFIRNLRDYNNLPENRGKLNVHPEIIPVMDDYRTTIAYSFYPMLESIEILEIKLKDLQESGGDPQRVALVQGRIDELKMGLIENELEQLVGNRARVIKSDEIVNDYSKILRIIEGLTRTSVMSEETIRTKINQRN